MSLKDIQGGSKTGGSFPGLKKPERERKLDINWKIIILAMVGLLLIYVMFMLFNALPSLLNPRLSEEEILEVSGNEPITRDFISKNPDYRTNITFLDREELEKLSEKYPAIYGDLNKGGIYRVEYSSDNTVEGVLLLIDGDKKVLKYYRVRSMTLTT